MPAMSKVSAPTAVQYIMNDAHPEAEDAVDGGIAIRSDSVRLREDGRVLCNDDQRPGFRSLTAREGRTMFAAAKDASR